MSTNSGISGIDIDNTYKGNTFSLIPFYRRYHFCSPQFALVGTAKLPIGFSNESEEYLTDPFDPSQGTDLIEYPSHTSIGFYVVPSFMWMPNRNWSLEASVGSIGFNSSSGSGDVNGTTIDYSAFQFIAKLYLLNPFIAFSYYFPVAE